MVTCHRLSKVLFSITLVQVREMWQHANFLNSGDPRQQLCLGLWLLTILLYNKALKSVPHLKYEAVRGDLFEEKCPVKWNNILSMGSALLCDIPSVSRLTLKLAEIFLGLVDFFLLRSWPSLSCGWQDSLLSVGFHFWLTVLCTYKMFHHKTSHHDTTHHKMYHHGNSHHETSHRGASHHEKSNSPKVSH